VTRSPALTRLDSIRHNATVFTLAVEADSGVLWLIESRAGSERVEELGSGHVFVRPKPGAWVIGGNFREGLEELGIREVRVGRGEYEVRTDPAGWFAVLPEKAERSPVTVEWLLPDGQMHHEVGIVLPEWISSAGPTYYGPGTPSSRIPD
jgi:hypothetical protein